MKNLILFLTLISASLSFSKCIDLSDGGDPKTHKLFTLQEVIIGEIDPVVLGDGGLLILSDPFLGGAVAIFEDNEFAPYATELAKYGVRVVFAVKKSCLVEASEDEAATLERVAGRLGFSGLDGAYILTE